MCYDKIQLFLPFALLLLYIEMFSIKKCVVDIVVYLFDYVVINNDKQSPNID